jgi:hypothetical protein
MLLMRTMVTVAAAGGVLIAAQAASAATLMRVEAESTSYASADRTRAWNVNRRQQRVRVNLVAQETVRPYTYDDNYNRVDGQDITRPTKGSGSVRLECLRTRNAPWYTSTDTNRTILANKITTIRIPLRNAARCRIRVDVTAPGSILIGNAETIAVTVSAVVTTVR